MSQFECSVRDLIEKPPERDAAGSSRPKSILSRGEYSVETDTSAATIADSDANEIGSLIANENENENVNVNVNVTLLEKITDQKNIRLFLIIIISYLITNSSQFIELMGNSFPYLAETGVTTLSGKLLIAILIGLSVVLLTTFFPVP